MNYLILDVECTTSNKGNPFDQRNKLCLVGLKRSSSMKEQQLEEIQIEDIEYSNGPYGEKLKTIRSSVESSDLLVGFNVKFDLHWIRKYVPDIKFPPVWDCQLGEFILSNQRNVYPSLDEVCTRLNLGSKLGTVDSEYWNNGIDTTAIPRSVLDPYLTQDLDLTEKLFQYQYPLLKDNLVFKLQCKDLLVLQEMEYNGLNYDTAESSNLVDSINS